MSTPTSTDPGKIGLKNVRLSFPTLFVAKSVNASEPKFSASFLIDKSAGNSEIEKVQRAIEAVKKAKWGANPPKGIKTCLHEGSSKDFDGYDETNMFVSASSARRPTVVDQRLNPLGQSDGKPYAGCFVNASIRLWAQDNQYGKRVNAELLAVQFVKDGEAFSAGGQPVIAENEFTVIEGDDEDLT